MIPEVTRLLAGFVSESVSGDIPAGAIEQAKRATLDVLGVTIAGATTHVGTIARDYAVSQSSQGSATVIGTSTRLSPSLAAFANGTTAHALDFDDLGLKMGHPSAAITPAALALAETTDASGRHLLDAIVIGFDVASRLANMYDDTYDGPFGRGYHSTSLYGVFGATAAAARVLGLSADQVRNAFGIAASQSGGLRVNFGSMAKPMHAGMSNRSGVEAALLASRGFTANPSAIEGRFGWYDTRCVGEGDLSNVVSGLGSHYAIEAGLLFKPYPTCGGCQYPIDAMRRAMRENHLTEHDIEQVEVIVQALVLEDVLECQWPETGLEGKFCIAYNVAAALVDGNVTLATFTNEAIQRLGAARPKVVVVGDPQRPRKGVVLNIRTMDGRTIRLDHDRLHGSLDDPMHWDELVEKFTANAAATLSPDATTDMVDALATLETQPNVHRLVPRVTPTPADSWA